MECKARLALALTALALSTSCSYNPFETDNHLTGSPLGAATGAGIGAGGAALAGSSKPIIVASGLIGATIGYYVTSLDFASGGVNKSGGQVFTQGDYAAIEIPSDKLFDTNSADFLSDAWMILDSAVKVLKRYPENNIMISGNTSGQGTTKFERKLSEARARQVAAYLWAHGINESIDGTLDRRKLIYTGFGNYFPIANNIHNDSLRQNSRIQITAYPTNVQLELDSHHKVFNNIGDLNEPPMKSKAPTLDESQQDEQPWGDYKNEASERHTTAGESVV